MTRDLMALEPGVVTGDTADAFAKNMEKTLLMAVAHGLELAETHYQVVPRGPVTALFTALLLFRPAPPAPFPGRYDVGAADAMDRDAV